MGSVANKVISAFEMDLNRKIKMDPPDLKANSGIILTKVCISQKPDFSNGIFFCADKVIISTDMHSEGNNKISFKKIILENPEININEKDGHWDFEDLSGNSSKKTEGFEDTWFIDNLVLKNAKIYAHSETNGLDFKIKNSDLSIKHEGKSFVASGKSLIQTDFNGNPAAIPAKLNVKASFLGGELSEMNGDIALEQAAFGKISIAKSALNMNMTGINKDIEEKRYILRFSSDGIIIPENDTLIYEKVPQYLKLFAAAVGRPAPVIKNAEIHNLKGHFRLEDNTVELQHFSLRSNFMEMDGEMKIDGNSGKTAAAADVSIGKNNIKMHISGPAKKPELRPVLSETLSKKLKEAYTDFEKYLLGHFPVMEK